MARTPLLERRLQLGAAAVLTVAEAARLLGPTPAEAQGLDPNVRPSGSDAGGYATCPMEAP